MAAELRVPFELLLGCDPFWLANFGGATRDSVRGENVPATQPSFVLFGRCTLLGMVLARLDHQLDLIIILLEQRKFVKPHFLSIIIVSDYI